MTTEADDPGRLLAQERLQVAVAELVTLALKERRLSRKRLATALEVKPLELSDWLTGRHELTLREVADMFHLLGYRLELFVAPESDPPARLGHRGGVSTATAVLRGGPGDGQTVQVPVFLLQGRHPCPAPVEYVAMVDGRAYAVDTTPQETLSGRTPGLLMYMFDFSTGLSSPIYRYADPHTQQ